MKGLSRASLEGSPRTGALGISLAVLLLVPAGLAGCGSGGGTSASVASTLSTPQARKQPVVATRSKGSTGSAGTTGSAGKTSAAATSPAREIGQKACAGMTPLQAAERYEMPARHAGVDKRFAKLVANPPASTQTSSGFPRLVAALYASTLPAPQRADAAAGCAEELASRSSGGQASSNRAKRQGLSSSGGQEEKGSN